MSQSPNPLYYRERQLVGGRPLNDDGRAAGLLPFSSATLWRMVKARKFPQPMKLADRITAWRADEVQAWLAGINGNGA